MSCSLCGDVKVVVFLLQYVVVCLHQARAEISPRTITVLVKYLQEVDTQLSNVPKPMPPQLEENLVFSAERAQQFKTVDTHAVQVAKTEHNSFRDLIWDLIYDKNITDDLEKARCVTVFCFGL